MRVPMRLAVAAVMLSVVVGSHPQPGDAQSAAGIQLSPLGVYETGLFDEGAIEIAAYDPLSRRAFLTFAAQPRIDVVYLSDPNHIIPVAPIDLTPWGAEAHATSVAVYDDYVAAAVPQGDEETGPGKILFFSISGHFLSAVTVGALPDMLTFTPDGSALLSANEGEPNDAYTIDPEGSISIVDMRSGARSLTDADVTTIGFRQFNSATLDRSIRIFGPRATVAQDLEPEYIAVSHDSRTAWVTLQENNAIAIVDLAGKVVTSLIGLGFKDHSRPGFGLDGGRDDNAIAIRPWPVRGMYQPDAIATFRHNGTTYLVTANEGELRDYPGLNAPKTSSTNDESLEIEDVVLDPRAFPDAATLQSRPNGIGRLKITSFAGDTDRDGDFDELHTFGARSFAVWSSGGVLQFDSGDLLEQITASAFPSFFNASHTNNTRDDRSDDKGPEPEGLVVAELFGRLYVFVMPERIGGIAVFALDDPRSPRFVQYINTRNFAATPAAGAGGDLGPEAALVLSAQSSPTGTPMLVLSNEVSGTLRLFAITAR